MYIRPFHSVLILVLFVFYRILKAMSRIMFWIHIFSIRKYFRSYRITSKTYYFIDHCYYWAFKLWLNVKYDDRSEQHHRDTVLKQWCKEHGWGSV